MDSKMLSDADRAQLAALGISEDEADRQLRIFAQPPPATVLDRPCTLGDGIAVLDDRARAQALQAHQHAAAAGRLLKFLPASGAATRMFKALLAVRGSGRAVMRAALERDAAAGDANAREVLTFADNLLRFAFAEALAAELARRGRNLQRLCADGALGEILAALLDPDGLNYAALPKGLLLFHRYPDGSRTAFEEHLLEAAAYVHPAELAQLHLTVSPEHRDAFHNELTRVRGRCERRSGMRLAVGFSEQQPATDTLAVDLDNRPFRTADAHLLLRPAGHGALLDNVNALDGDIVFIKTIDNIQPEHRRDHAIEWMRILTGHLVVIQDELFGHIARLHADAVSPQTIAAARAFARQTLAIPLPDDGSRSALLAALDRPLRVCGMVRNSGEPGGGPFWVRAARGDRSRQIVESAQIDAANREQRAVFESSTHFNPVFLACGVRNWRGQPFDLRAFVDQSAVFIARKSSDGRELQALERPGLWNGAMAGWHTLFVEIPDATFTPVKTVNDLLRPAHQPPDSEAVRDSDAACRT
jgi:hypothetical protein